jgi:hypothetical protein
VTALTKRWLKGLYSFRPWLGRRPEVSAFIPWKTSHYLLKEAGGVSAWKDKEKKA